MNRLASLLNLPPSSGEEKGEEVEKENMDSLEELLLYRGPKDSKTAKPSKDSNTKTESTEPIDAQGGKESKKEADEELPEDRNTFEETKERSDKSDREEDDGAHSQLTEGSEYKAYSSRSNTPPIENNDLLFEERSSGPDMEEEEEPDCINILADENAQQEERLSQRGKIETAVSQRK